MDIADQLVESSLFRGVERADREALIKVMRRQSYPQGAVLFRRGDPGDSMYIILKGKVRIFTQDRLGNEITLRYLVEMFGEFSMLDGQPRSASAAAAEELEVLVLHRDAFNAFVRERPLVGLSMMRNLVERVRYTTNYLKWVLDATEQISQGNYEAVQPVQDSSVDSEIQELVGAFFHMAHEVQAREEMLKHDPK